MFDIETVNTHSYQLTNNELIIKKMQNQPLSQLSLEQILNRSLTNRSLPSRESTFILKSTRRDPYHSCVAENPPEIQEIMKGKLEYLRSLSKAEKEFDKIGSQTRKKKAVTEIVAECTQILKIFGLKLNIVERELKKDYFNFTPVSDEAVLAHALLDIVFQLNEIPFNFFKKLKLKELTICDVLQHYGDKEKSKEYTKKRILTGVLPLQVLDIMDSKTFIKKVTLNYYLKCCPNAYQDWTQFSYSIEDYLKVPRSDPLASMSDVWNFILEKNESLPNKIRDLKCGKLLSMLSDFDATSFKPVENLQIGKINKADLAI